MTQVARAIPLMPAAGRRLRWIWRGHRRPGGVQRRPFGHPGHSPRVLLSILVLTAAGGLSGRSAQLPSDSTDWEAVGEPLMPGGVITQLVADPTRTAHLFAIQEQTANGQTLAETWDAARHWHTITRLRQLGFRSLAVDPAHPARLYAGGDTGLYRSENAGRDWTQVSAFPAAISVPTGNTLNAVEGGPPTPACPSGQPIFVSSADGGLTWSQTKLRCGVYGPLAGSTSDPLWINVRALDPDLGEQFLAQSSDGGRSWRYLPLTGSLFNQGLFPVAINPAEARTLLSSSGHGIIVSRDGGQSWRSALDIDETGAFHFAFSADAIYAGLDSTLANAMGALYRSRDGGETWQRLAAEFPGNLTALLLSDGRPDLVVVGLDGYGVQRSTDAGRTWQPANDGLLSTTRTTRLVPVPQQAGHLLALTNWPRPGLFRSTDAGRTWSGPVLETELANVAIDPRGGLAWAVGPQGWFESQAEGGVWRRVASTSGSDVALSPAAPDRPCATHTEHGQGYVVCRRAGAVPGDTWEQFPVAGSLAVTRIAVSPARGDLIFVGGTPDFRAGAVYRSADHGQTWQTCFRAPPDHLVFDLAVSADDPARIIAVLGQYHPDHLRVVLSRDAGQTWQEITADLERVAGTLGTAFTFRASALIDSVGATYLAAGNLVLVQPPHGAAWQHLGQLTDRLDTAAIEPAPDGAIWLAGETAYWRSARPSWSFAWLPLVGR